MGPSLAPHSAPCLLFIRSAGIFCLCDEDPCPPNGLSGDEICEEARILAVADVVEAMTSDHPYRAARGLDAALAEIESHSGVLYDPRVADACIALFREGRFAFPTAAD